MTDMTDADLDTFIDQAKPELRNALRAVLTGQSAQYLFDIAALPLPNGQTWAIVCAVLNEPVATMVEAIGDGLDRMNESMMKVVPPEAAQAAQAQMQQPPPPRRGGKSARMGG